ncbi:hypothetical protein [Enterococcus faecalis]|nr:hypothetical protein [Enterococcus faecalis]
MNEVKITVTVNGQHMTSYEADENIYKALLDALQTAHMFIIDES